MQSMTSRSCRSPRTDAGGEQSYVDRFRRVDLDQRSDAEWLDLVAPELVLVTQVVEVPRVSLSGGVALARDLDRHAAAHLDDRRSELADQWRV